MRDYPWRQEGCLRTIPLSQLDSPVPPQSDETRSRINATMAPHLSTPKRHRMPLSKLPIHEIAKTVERAVCRIRSRLGRFGTKIARTNRVGPDHKVALALRDAPCE